MTVPGKGGRPLKYKTVEEMQVLIDKYFEDCDKVEDPYTITGLALALDFSSRRDLLDYQGRPEFALAIRNAKLRVENWSDKKLLKGNGNPTGSIFNLKVNFGWKDTVNVEVESKDSVIKDSIESKIKELDEEAQKKEEK